MGFFNRTLRTFASFGSLAVQDVCFVDGKAALQMGGRLITIETTTGKILSDVSTTQTQTSISFLDSTHVGGFNQSDTTGRVVDVIAGTVTTKTGLNTARTSGKSQTFAGDLANSKGLACSSTSAKLIQLDTTPNGAEITVTGAGSQFNCIIYAGSGVYYAGTNAGKVFEVDYTGAITDTITLPTAPTVNTSPTLKVSSLALSGTFLFISDQFGSIYVYNASTNAFVSTDEMWSGDGADNFTTGPLFSNVVNGVSVLANERSGASSGAIISLWDLQQRPYMDLDEFPDPYTSSIINMYLDATNELFVYARSNTVSTGVDLIIMNMNGLVGTTVPTRARDAGSDQTLRSVLMANPKDYRCRIESDQSLPPGVETLAVRFKDIPYFEVGSIGTEFSSEKNDVRSF